jgi:hypothetical protein
VVTEIEQIITQGYFLAVANGFAADLELLTTVEGSISDGFTTQFLSVPVGAFEVSSHCIRGLTDPVARRGLTRNRSLALR